MKNLIIPCLAVAFATSLAQASPADDVKAAAKKLADAPNYTWTTAMQNAGGGGGFGGGSVTGVTEKDGYTVVTRETQNGAFQTARKGDEVVLQNFQTGEWMTADEMRQQFGNRGGGGGGPGGGARKEGAAPDAERKEGTAPANADRKGGPGGGRGGPRGGMFGVTTPAEEVVTLLENAKDLKAEDGVITGTLNEEAVTQRITFGGRGGRGGGAPAAKDTSGTVKFWLKDGALTKYEVHAQGTVNGRNGEMKIDRTTTTEIKDVGSTKVEVPAEAKKKLGA